MDATVDIVIPTYNRHVRLASTLRSIASQTASGYRTIVVDDGSSPPVAASLDPELVAAANVTCLTSSGNGGPARARNAGVAAGSARFIAFVDDDVDPVSDWLMRHLAVHRSGAPLATIGPLLPPPGWQPTPWNWWEARTLAREYGKMQRGLYAPTCRQFFTGNAVVRRQDFEAAGGFDEHLLRAEDIEFGLRMQDLGTQFRFVATAAGWHDSYRSAESWLRMARQYAAADRLIDRLHPDQGWAEMVARERAGRKRAMRLARRIDRPGQAHERVVRSLMLAARATFALGARSASSRALAMAFDLEYAEGARRAAALDGQDPSHGTARVAA